MKKFLILTLILISSCSTVFAYSYQGFELPSTSGVDDTFYGVETVKNILDGLNISYDDSTLPGYTYQINEAMKILSEKYDFLTARNICFIKDVNSRLYLDPSNGTFSNDLYYLRLGEWYGNYRIYHIEDINSPFSSLNFTDTYLISNTSYSLYNSNNYITIPGVTFSDDVVNSSAIIAPISTFSVAGATPSAPSVYNWYFLSNTFEFTKTEEPPSGGGSGSGEGGTSPDLDGISQGIDNINNNLNNIENKIPSSGDIENAVTQGTFTGSEQFWGNSGDLTGEQQEELIEGKVDELIENISGDMAENEIFGILQNYENKLFGSFTGEEDFKISWQNINYMGTTIIPSGEVNFSQMCRDNEALGRVKSTINIILGFFLLMNCVIYLYNLFLATLGIDNPYLYEGRVGSVTVNEFTDENGRTTVTRTQHDGLGNSISRKYNHTIEPKKRQIGFRK